MHQMFTWQAKQTPDHIAVVCGDQKISYRALNESANQLAHCLIGKHGIKPDTLVGLCTERSVEMIIGILAILKAGGAYVPMDPNYPQERLSYMLEDAGLELVLTQSQLSQCLPGFNGSRVYIDAQTSTELTENNRCPKETPEPVIPDLTANHLAYVIYTSGSTGKPKGVLIEHQNMQSLANEMQTWFLGESINVVALNANYVFDASIQAISALLSGQRLVILPDEIKTAPDKLQVYIDNNKIDLIDSTPSMLQVWLESETELDLPHMLVGGEAIHADLWIQLTQLQARSGKQFYNVYGPTECTVNSTYTRIAGETPHLGSALSYASLYVLGEQLQQVPPQTTGELYIGGKGLARGYLNRPQLTAESFIDNPYYDEHQPGSSKRLYKTGDLVRFLSDGKLAYIGRKDNQVKIRGYRIEPEEIEQALCRLTSVTSCKVLVHEYRPGQKRLIAFALPSKQQQPTEKNLAKHWMASLHSTLPEYMLPSTLVAVDHWPLTPNGKLDHQALVAMAKADDGLVLLTSEFESRDTLIAQLENLDLSLSLGELGLDSLNIIQLKVRLARLMDIDGSRLLMVPQTLLQSIYDELIATNVSISFAAKENYLASYTQRRFLQSSQRIDVNDNVMLCFTFDRAVGEATLTAFVKAFVDKHTILRSAITPTDKGVRVCATDLCQLQHIHASFERDKIFETLNHAFKFEQGDVARFLILTHDDKLSLLMNLYHGITDGFAKSILIEELVHFVSTGTLTAKQGHYSQFAQYEQHNEPYFKDQIQENAAYFHSNFSKEAQKISHAAIKKASGYFKTIKYSELQHTALKNNLMDFKLSYHQFFVALAAYSLKPFGQHSINVVSPVSNRLTNDSMNTFGCFINLVVMQHDLAADTFEEFFNAHRNSYHKAQALSAIPWHLVVDEYPGFVGDLVVVGGVKDQFQKELDSIQCREVNLEHYQPCSKNAVTLYYDLNEGTLDVHIMFNRDIIADDWALAYQNEIDRQLRLLTG
ncbi:non-ribosomal peptide synthetase [Thalassomonas haliotis]|uniref:Amino acid adenylation domain-containing protein n=1 Tax=Thalassomonas haliotis TaxID=485448 RepID=A0ABY7VEM6_9GAMM|nr:non-ribosomal peptide synthetase [Thalassomonas haliotis]WDE11827.1 amino acid adenylation domain-containing protein [Thalassomonas haliotis]